MSARIGKLRHRLTIERETLTDDGGGGAAAVWEEAGTVWAAIEAVSGKETVEAGRIAGRATYAITIRYRSDLEPAMRFRLGNELFEIKSLLDPDGRSRFLTCQCEICDL